MATTKKSKTRTKAMKRSSKKSDVKPATQGTCFVMMPFENPFDVYYDNIYKPAIIKAKLDPIRADDLFRPSVIVSDLWKMIQGAKVLLAELTTKNANVFYELGLAHAIGKPIILVSETMDDVPFDLQQLRVLLYDKNDPAWGDKLSDGITNAITETLDSPIDAVPSIFRKTVASKAPEQNATVSRLNALESQVRILRAQQPLRNKNIGQWEKEVATIDKSEELDRWVRKWRERGLPMTLVLGAIKEWGKVPPGEAERIEREFSV